MTESRKTTVLELAPKDLDPGLTQTNVLDAREIEDLKINAELALRSISEPLGKKAGYDALTVKLLSSNVDSIRSKLDEAGRLKIANIYGVCLGFALLAADEQQRGQWVRNGLGDIAICFDNLPNGTLLFLPITRVFKHIDEGPEYSIIAYYEFALEMLKKGVPQRPAVQEQQGAPEVSAARSEVPSQAVSMGQAKDGSDVVVAIPIGLCCNCGSKKSVKNIDSPMHHRRALDGREVQFSVELPYCKTCAYTAGRQPKSFAYKAMGTFIAYAVLMFCVLMPLSKYEFFVRWNGALLILFTLGVIAFFYFLRKPNAPATSVYQPVNLANFSGNHDGLKYVGFKFSNKEYAQVFKNLNARAIRKGVLKVS